jgi:hypothetical protein
VNELRFTYSQRQWAAKMPGSGKGYPAKLGLVLPPLNLNPPVIPDAPEAPAGPNDAFPAVTVENYDALANGFAGAGGYQKPMRNFHFIDTFSHLKGSHSFKAGFEMRRSTSDYFYSNRPDGQYNFDSRPTASAPTDPATGNGFASVLLGWPASATINSIGERTLLSYWFAGFIQDDWRVSPTLMVNLGVRYENDTPMTELSSPPKVVGFDVNATNPVCNCPGTVTFPTTFHDPDRNNFGPRIGVTWNPSKGRTVLRAAYGVFYSAPYVNSIWSIPGYARPDSSVTASFNTLNNGITAPFLMKNGVPPIPQFQPSDLNPGYGAVPIGQAPYKAPDFYNRNRPNPYNHMVTFNVQRELPNQIVAEAGYIGNFGHRLNVASINLNQVPVSLMGPGNAQVRRPFPQFSGLLDVSEPSASSRYNALVLKVEKRFASSLGFQANYTFSKFLDNVIHSNVYNFNADWGRSQLMLAHRFVFSGVWETPFGTGRRFLNHGVPAAILGGWNIGAVVSLQSGLPFTVTMAQNLCNCFSAGAIRPNVVADPHGAKTIQQWFNTSAFQSSGPYAFGNAGTGILLAPGKFNIDSSVIKNFRITERLSTEIRAEFFNTLNHVNLGAPGTALGSPTFGVIRSADDPRVIQLGAKVNF